jgi:predicted SnoaL-like aldol condensation-catalyzing enzyme
LSAAANRKLVEEFYAAGGPVGDVQDFPRFFGPTYVSHTSPEGVAPGMAQAEALLAFLGRTFSDVEYELLRVVADDEHAAVHAVMHATHTGDGLGVPPTDRRISAEQMHFVRFEDGKIVEHWAVRDDAGLLRQLG